MTREEIKKARDLLKMIEVKEPNELIVNSWWGSFVKDYKEALQIAIKVLEKELDEAVEVDPVIKVLEQQPSIDTVSRNCDNCVIRKAVLEVLKNNRYRFNISQEGYCEGKVW